MTAISLTGIRDSSKRTVDTASLDEDGESG